MEEENKTWTKFKNKGIRFETYLLSRLDSYAEESFKGLLCGLTQLWCIASSSSIARACLVTEGIEGKGERF